MLMRESGTGDLVGVKCFPRFYFLLMDTVTAFRSLLTCCIEYTGINEAESAFAVVVFTIFALKKQRF
jgi:hypothetical protein